MSIFAVGCGGPIPQAFWQKSADTYNALPDNKAFVYNVTPGAQTIHWFESDGARSKAHACLDALRQCVQWAGQYSDTSDKYCYIVAVNENWYANPDTFTNPQAGLEGLATVISGVSAVANNNAAGYMQAQGDAAAISATNYDPDITPAQCQ